MSADLRSEAVATLSGWTAPTPEQEELRAHFESVARTPDGHLRSASPGHLTASTLVMDAEGTHVLLMLHKKAQQWFQMGGHLEPEDDSLQAAALREATEESGIEGLVLDTMPVHLDRHTVGFCHPDGPVDHLDVRFVAQAPPGAQPVVNDESESVRWWPVDDLPTEESGVVDLVAAALARPR